MQKVKIIIILSGTLCFQQVVFYSERHPKGKGNDLFSEMGRKTDTQHVFCIHIALILYLNLFSHHGTANPTLQPEACTLYTSHDSTTRDTRCLNPQFSRWTCMSGPDSPSSQCLPLISSLSRLSRQQPSIHLHPRQCQLRCEYCMNECVCLGTICYDGPSLVWSC